MTNIRNVINMIFKNINYEKILSSYFNNNFEDIILDKKTFLRNFGCNNSFLYNKDEIENIYFILKNNWAKDGIFNILLKFTNDILKEEGQNILCRYNELFRWRELSYQLGEDIFTTSFLAGKDLEYSKERKYFGWKPIISNDNKRLMEILKMGLAENHFHLKGSSPHFQLNWIYLMNNILHKDCKKKLKNFDNELRLSPNIFIDDNPNTKKFSEYIKIAVIIRYYLYLLIENKYESFKKETDLTIENILEKDYLIDINLKKIFNHIKIEAYQSSKKIEDTNIDYWIPKNISNENYENIFLCGERIFLYKAFKKCFSNDINFKKAKPLFFLYIIIKQKFRCEIVQINNEIGFGNFSDYQDRKTYFLKNKKLYEKAIVTMAIKSSTPYEYIDKLEARIAPITKIIDIKNLDKQIENIDLYKLREKKEVSNEKKFFYTIHFIKTSEKFGLLDDKNKNRNMIFPRNYNVRIFSLKQAKKLIGMKNSKNKLINRVLGIDGANVEIGCRPEVLAPIYRLIKKEDRINGHIPFGITYHVGEEFLDIIDGLRAIDEAILFMNLERGDRIGHALALGIDAKEYYSTKKNILLLPKQDILDNVAWIYHKIKDFDLIVPNSFVSKLQYKYNKLFLEIYGEKYVTIDSYYDFLNLRGNCPSLYSPDSELLGMNLFDSYKRNLNKKVLLSENNKEACQLYEMYHYDHYVKKNGGKIEEYLVTDTYILVARELQKKLQKEISKIGIFIETNPSSNLLIGTIDKYSNHPITKFYNLGLTNNYEDLNNSEQLCVSINTDDQGVFGTSIENEYALMALALEKEKDENGNQKYNPSMIYNWLNQIRIMGLEQSFYSKSIQNKF